MNKNHVQSLKTYLLNIPAIAIHSCNFRYISEHYFAFKRTFSLIYLLNVCLMFLRKGIVQVHGIITAVVVKNPSP